MGRRTGRINKLCILLHPWLLHHTQALRSGSSPEQLTLRELGANQATLRYLRPPQAFALATPRRTLPYIPTHTWLWPLPHPQAGNTLQCLQPQT